ncbi:MAG: glycosyltransferase family 2 protein [Candidatus Doudnabacteria bacterium]|nr:glycosyltransferase family 2 protein [Candidatus Doudnabacteria bacterium]
MNNKRDGLTRFLEIFPGILTWGTLLGAPLLSYYHPVWVSVYIIAFDLYWFLKGGNVALHLLHSYATLKTHNKLNWMEWLERLANPSEFRGFLSEKIQSEPNYRLKRLYTDQLECVTQLSNAGREFDWKKIYHLIIAPTYKESLEVVELSVKSYLAADYPKDHLIFVLAVEERAGVEAQQNAEFLRQKYEHSFFDFLVVKHPDGIPGEAKGKGANITYAAKTAQKYLDGKGILYENVLVSVFDIDTVIDKQYFSHLTFDFLTTDKPHQTSYQPMPLFHNNIWDTPAIARVIAVSSSFWQLVEASRPDRLITFSSHSMSFKTVVDVGFWRVDIIPEDSHIFWQCFLHFNGDYRTRPLFTTVSMDAVLGESYMGTLVAQYKQKRRWAWGVTEISMVIPEFIKNTKIPLWKKLLYAERLIEGHYFWATASIMIAILGWMPLYLGGTHFGTTVVAVNLPIMTRAIMSIATFFLLFSMYVNMVLLPPRPKGYPWWKSVSMIVQWVFSPIVSSVFGSMPAIDAQTRLMFGRYMEFWVTPKIRKSTSVNNPEVEQAVIK